MKILIAGDYCPRDRVVKAIEEGWPIFTESVLYQIQSADYSIVNFECAVADATMKSIAKCGPNLRCSEKAVRALKEAGFKCVTLANNHFRDYGSAGVRLTIDVLDHSQIDHVGGGNNIKEVTAVLYKQIDGKTMAFINVCENEFSIADEYRGGSAPLDTVDVSRRIMEARKQSDYVVLIIHGGHEHYQYPSPRMVKLYRFFVEMGADAVVNHHQHCFSGYEVYQEKPIVYGLGNFCFDHPKKRAGIWNVGYMIVLELSDKGISYELIPYLQCDKNPDVDLLSEEQKKVFDERVTSISHTICDETLLKNEYEKYISCRRQTVITPFTPYLTKYSRAAAGRHYLPYLIPQKKLADMLNYVQCEAHRDVLTRVMQERLEKN